MAQEEGWLMTTSLRQVLPKPTSCSSKEPRATRTPFTLGAERRQGLLSQAYQHSCDPCIV